MIPIQMETIRWTAKEFEQQVLASSPKVAVFDCDGTLWGGDSGYGFMVWSIEKGLVSRSTSDWIDTRYRGYLAGTVLGVADVTGINVESIVVAVAGGIVVVVVYRLLMGRRTTA